MLLPYKEGNISVNKVARPRAGRYTVEDFEKQSRKLRKEGNAVPSRLAAVLNQYAGCQGWPYRFNPRDVADLHAESVLPGSVTDAKGRVQFSLAAVLDWLVTPQEMERAIEILSAIGERRAAEEHERKLAEKFARDAREKAQALYQERVNKRAREICSDLDAGAHFEQDLAAAVSGVIQKHYEAIPATVARLIAKEIDTKMNLQQAARKYGHRFTAGILDALTESWLKRILSTGGRSVDRSAVDRALKWVGSVRQRSSTVYIIKPSGIRAAKIGIAACLDSRIGGIQTGSPFPVKCLLAFPGGRMAEEMIHKAFQATRLSGEWFVLDATMQQFVIEGRSKLNKLLAITESERLGQRFQRHLDLIHKHACQDWISESYGMSYGEAEKLANQVNALLEEPENAMQSEMGMTA